jgi:hypothetical protein
MAATTPVRPMPIDLWREAEGEASKYRQLLEENGHPLPGRRQQLVSFMGTKSDVRKEFTRRGISTKKWDDERLVSEWDTVADLASRSHLPMSMLLDELARYRKKGGKKDAQQNVD